jgi:hypothetical protein
MHTFSNIIEKIKEIKHLKFDKDVAKLLNIKYRRFTTQKYRNTIPYEALFIFCNNENIPFEVIFGDKIEEGNQAKTDRVSEQMVLHYSGEEIKATINAVIDIMQSNNETVKAALKSNIAAFQYTVECDKKIKNLERDINGLKKALNQQDPDTEAKGG